MLVGHNTLRLMVMGMDNRPPTAGELQAMSDLLEEGLRAGALGFSTGLFTAPGSYAATDEIVALCRVVKRHNAGYFTHLRDESNKVLDALQEAIDVAEVCQVHVEIVHFKCSGLDNWGKAAKALDMIAAAKARGVDVDCDSYPYNVGSNPLKNLLPQWVQAGGVPDMLARLALPETRTRIRAEIARDGLNNWGRIPDWDCVRISISPHLPQYARRSIAELARERGADPIDVVCDYLIEDRCATRVLVISIAEDDVRDMIRSPFALVGSDGNCVADYGITSQGIPHPRFYGTFPRVLSHYARELGLIPIETAVHKMTGGDRGRAEACRPRPAQGRLSRRCGGVRSGRFRGAGDLRRSAPLSERSAHDGAGQWRHRRRQRRPHRRVARQGVAPRRGWRGALRALSANGPDGCRARCLL